MKPDSYIWTLWHDSAQYFTQDPPRWWSALLGVVIALAFIRWVVNLVPPSARR